MMLMMKRHTDEENSCRDEHGGLAENTTAVVVLLKSVRCVSNQIWLRVPENNCASERTLIIHIGI